MDALLQKFPPGQASLPHRFVVLALANVAEHNDKFSHILSKMEMRLLCETNGNFFVKFIQQSFLIFAH